MSDWLPVAVGIVAFVVVVASVAAALNSADAVREIRKVDGKVDDLTARWERGTKR